MRRGQRNNFRRVRSEGAFRCADRVLERFRASASAVIKAHHLRIVERVRCQVRARFGDGLQRRLELRGEAEQKSRQWVLLKSVLQLIQNVHGSLRYVVLCRGGGVNSSG